MRDEGTRVKVIVRCGLRQNSVAEWDRRVEIEDESRSPAERYSDEEQLVVRKAYEERQM